MAYADPHSPQAIACWQRNNEKRKWKVRAARYNISEEALHAMWDEQGHCCAICGRDDMKSPHVDHDHATGRVRGILCASCNRMLGLAKDDPQRLYDAAQYLLKARER